MKKGQKTLRREEGQPVIKPRGSLLNSFKKKIKKISKHVYLYNEIKINIYKIKNNNNTLKKKEYKEYHTIFIFNHTSSWK